MKQMTPPGRRHQLPFPAQSKATSSRGSKIVAAVPDPRDQGGDEETTYARLDAWPTQSRPSPLRESPDRRSRSRFVRSRLKWCRLHDWCAQSWAHVLHDQSFASGAGNVDARRPAGAPP
jgi:hypothetical protein